MRRMISSLGIAVILAAAGPAGAGTVRGPAKGTARSQKSPVIELKGSFPGPKIRHDRTTAQIERIRTLEEPKGWHNPGLTVSEHVLNTRYGLAVEQDKPGALYRVYVTDLVVDFGYTLLEVYVASEYPKGSCEYREILAHEMDHVRIHSDVYRKYRRLLKERLEASKTLPTKSRPLLLKKASSAQAQVDRIVKGITAPLVGAFGKELIREQGRIDTPANYKAIQKRCDQWRK